MMARIRSVPEPSLTGSATFSPSSLSAGSHSITAVYGGDTGFAGSTSNILSQVVQSESTTSISSSANPSAAGQLVTFTATVTPVSPERDSDRDRDIL